MWQSFFESRERNVELFQARSERGGSCRRHTCDVMVAWIHIEAGTLQRSGCTVGKSACFKGKKGSLEDA